MSYYKEEKNDSVFQVGLEGQLCEEVYPRSFYFFNMLISISKSILIISKILLLIFVHDFGILKQLFISTLFPTKVRSGSARVVANIETAGNNYIINNKYISK